MQTVTFQPWISFKASSEQISTELEDDIVILNTQTGKYYSLEGVGSQIWRAILKGEKLEAIEQSIKTNYPIGSESHQEDIHTFISSLCSAGLINAQA